MTLNKRKATSKIKGLIMIVILVLVLIGIYNPFKDKILEARGVKENHCIQEESYYYRTNGWFIFSSRVKTTQENSDGIDYKCIEWEEEPLIGKSFFGQRLVHEKGSLISGG